MCAVTRLKIDRILRIARDDPSQKVSLQAGTHLASRIRSRGPSRNSRVNSRNSLRCKPLSRCRPAVKSRAVAPYDDASRLRYVYLRTMARTTPLSRVVLRRAPLASSVQSAQNDTRILVLHRHAARRPRMMTPF